MSAQQLSDAELFAIAGIQPPATPAPAVAAGDPSQPRNMRNNNPGNIEDGPFARSLPGYAGSDGRFAIFDNPQAGTAAKLRLLKSYGDRGFDTPREIIGRWAPASDGNDVDGYASFVSRKLGVNPDDPLDMMDDATLMGLAGAIQEFEGGPAMAALQGEGSDLTAMSDEELFAAAGLAAPGDEAVSGVMAIAAPETGARPGSGYIDAKTGEPLNEAQTKTYAGLAASGALDRNATPGSEKFPLAQRNPNDLPKPGDWYVGVDGKLAQVPGVPMLGTAVNMAAFALGGPKSILDLAASVTPMKRGGLPGLADAMPADPRMEAMKRALMSGLLMGGRNELAALIEAAPALVTGGMDAAVQRFDDTLDREDAASGQARRDFPRAYDASAVVGGLAGGAVLPGGATTAARIGIGAGTGAAGGFLATDGTTRDRLVGAGLGAGLGAALPLLPIGRGAPRPVGQRDMAEAGAALERLGVSLNDLPQEATALLTRELSRGAEPADAAIMALNRSLPVEIPLKRGDITGLPTDQFDFNAALRGGRGEAAAGMARNVVDGQQDAIRAGADQIARNLAGGLPPAIGRGAEAGVEALLQRRQAMKAGVDDAYGLAREMGDSAMLDSAADVRNAMLGGLRDFDLQDVPAVARVVESFGEGGAPTARQIFDARARLSKLRQAGGLESAAASDAIGALDRSVNEAMTNDLILGDPAAIDQWRAAIAANREYAEIFKSGDLVDKLTRQTGGGGARQLEIDPADAANLIFGRSTLGMVGRKNLYRDLTKVRDLLGPESEGWNQLRAEAFMRFANAGETTLEGGVPQFSGAAMQKAWNKANREDARLMDLLFTDEERGLISRFATMSSRITSPVRGGDNPSNTAIAAKRLLGQIGSQAFAVGKLVPFVNVTLVELERMASAAAARASTRPTPRRRGVPLRQLPGRAAGFTASSLVAPSEPNLP